MSDILSKILATENIYVQRGGNSAYFEIENRVLNLPLWDCDYETEFSLILHEVGHAIYTGTDYIDFCKDYPNLSTILNVIEDGRIEVLIKRKYPGASSIMFNGYKKLYRLLDSGFDPETANIIDRINYYLKFNHVSPITLSDKEEGYVKRILDLADLLGEEMIIARSKIAIDLSKDLISSQISEDPILFSSFGDEEDVKGERNLEEDLLAQLEELNSINSYGHNNLGSKVDVAVIDDQIINVNLNPMDGVYIEKIENTPLFDKFSPGLNLGNMKSAAQWKSFRKESERYVSYMLKEFNMRKAATRQTLVQHHTSGQLNLSKLYSYKFNDNIFKKISVIQDDQNHGMVFLLDWSSSMSNIITKMIKKLAVLLMFCRKQNIPFKVYLCAEGSDKVEDESKNKSKFKVISSIHYSSCWAVCLFEILNSEMKEHTFNSILMNMIYSINNIFQYYRLSSTPINDSLYFLNDHLYKIKNQFSTEKLTLMVLTDGYSNNIRVVDENSDPVKSKKFHFFDPITRKSYILKDSEFHFFDQTRFIVKLIRDRHNVSVLGFFITSTPSSCSSHLLNTRISPKGSMVVYESTEDFDKFVFALPESRIKPSELNVIEHKRKEYLMLDEFIKTIA